MLQIERFSLSILVKKLNLLQIQNNSVARGFQNNEVCFEIPLLLICFVFAKYLFFISKSQILRFLKKSSGPIFYVMFLP